MMKTLITSLSILAFTSIPLFAGTKDGGGGKGVLCGSTLRVLDLYESEVLNDVISGPDYGSFEDNLEGYKPIFFEGLPRAFPLDRMLKTLVLNRFKDIPAGTTLPNVEDVTVPTLPSGCKLVQIAIYKDRKFKILRDRKLWDMLSPRDQVALVFHELIYRTQRIHGESTSDLTRWGVALKMSQDAGQSEMPSLNFIPKIWCATEGYSWVMVEQKKNGVNGIGIFFKSYRNKFQTQPRSTFVPGFNLPIFSKLSLAFITNIESNGESLRHEIRTSLEGKKIKISMFPEGELPFSGYCSYVKRFL